MLSLRDSSLSSYPITAAKVELHGDDSWFLEKVVVVDTKRTTVVTLPCVRWLDTGVDAADDSKDSYMLYPGVLSTNPFTCLCMGVSLTEI